MFSELRVLFSIGGRHFPSDGAVTYFYMPDLFLDNARNVSIHLGFKLARYLKLQFTFAAEWFVISEIYFQSGTCDVGWSAWVQRTAESFQIALSIIRPYLLFIEITAHRITHLRSNMKQS